MYKKGQILESIARGEIKNHKSFGPLRPEDRLPTRKTKKQEESILQREIIETLHKLGLGFFFRIRNGATYDPTIGRYRSNTALKGIPDVCGHRKKDARACYIEVKFMRTKKGKSGKMLEVKSRISPEQIEFLSKCEADGALTGIAYNLQDAIDIVKNNPRSSPRHPRTYEYKDKEWRKAYMETYKQLIHERAERNKDVLYKQVLSAREDECL